MRTRSGKLSVLFLCLLSGLACVSAFAQGPADTYTEAASAFQQGQLDQAEQKLRTAIAVEPDRPDLLGLLGLVLDAKKQYEQAEVFHQRALKLAPRSAGLWNNFGNHYFAQGKYKEARGAFVHVLAIEPRHANANLQLARIALSDKQATEALHYLRNLKPSDQRDPAVQLLRARCLHLAGQPEAAMAIVDRLEGDPTADARLVFSLGVILAEWKKYERAEADFSRALKTDPTNVEILHNLGLAALRAGHLDRAQRLFEVALEQSPNDVESTFNLARVHAAKGENETALVFLSRARRLAPGRADLLLYLAETYEEAGFFNGAAAAYEEYLKLEPNDSHARRERGFTYCRFGRSKTALPDLEWFAKQYPRDPVGHFELGLCETLGDVSQAMQQLDETIRLKPDFTSARYVRGSLQSQDGRWSEALPDLIFVVEREPKNAMALLQLGRAHLELGSPAVAIEFLRRAQQSAPEHRGVLIQLQRALRKSGQNQKAADVLAKLKTLGPDPVDVKASAHIFEFLGEDPTEQRERFRRNLTTAAADNPADPELKVQMGALLLNDGKMADALADFRDILTQSPGTRILDEASRVLIEHEQYALAREFLARLVAVDPSLDNRLELALATFHAVGPEASLAELENIPVADRNGDVYLLKAQLLDALGRFGESVESLNAGFRMEPKRADLYFWASLFLIKHNRDQQALALLDQATKIISDDPDLLVTKAVVLELVRETDKADALLEKVELRWPEWGRSYLIQGIVQATHRKNEEALQSLRTAIALGEKTASAYYYLADLTRMVKPDDKAEIQQAVSEALRLDPSDALTHALAGKIALDEQDPTKAAEQLKEAIRLQPNLAEAHYSLILAYKKLGRESEAKAESDTFRRIRQQNPDSENDTTEIRQMLFAGDRSR